MRRILAVTVFVAAALPLFAVTQRPLIVTSQNHALVWSDDCDHFQTLTDSAKTAGFEIGYDAVSEETAINFHTAR